MVVRSSLGSPSILLGVATLVVALDVLLLLLLILLLLDLLLVLLLILLVLLILVLLETLRKLLPLLLLLVRLVTLLLVLLIGVLLLVVGVFLLLLLFVVQDSPVEDEVILYLFAAEKILHQSPQVLVIRPVLEPQAPAVTQISYEFRGEVLA